MTADTKHSYEMMLPERKGQEAIYLENVYADEDGSRIVPQKLTSSDFDDESILTLDSLEDRCVKLLTSDFEIRSIFRNYWVKNSPDNNWKPCLKNRLKKSLSFTTESTAVSTISMCSDEVQSLFQDVYEKDKSSLVKMKNVEKISYENHIERSDSTPCKYVFTELKSQFRRRIFPIPTRDSSSSLPSMQSVGCKSIHKFSPCLRRTLSVPEGKTKTFIGESLRRSVSFDPRVSVFEFANPTQNHTGAGWSKLFH